jgi:hypothetical protein
MPSFSDTSTAENFFSSLTKNGSLPSARHSGWWPPALDTCHRRPVEGKAWTYTSGRPFSLEAYASQRTSGENCGSTSGNGVCTIT